MTPSPLLKPVCYEKRDATGNHEMLFFNISAVSSEEEISKARLHLHRRRMTKPAPRSRDRQLLPPPCRVIFYQTRSPEARPRRLATLPISPRSPGGWTPLDVTAALRELHGRPLLLGVRFEGPKGVRLTVNNFLKHSKPKKNKSSTAYLVVISSSDEEEGLDEPKERHLKHKERKIDHNEMPNEISSLTSPADVRHHSKHKVYEVRRSKEAEIKLRQRTHLQSLPFLHVDEVADMRRSLRRAKRALRFPENGEHYHGEKSPHHKQNLHQHRRNCGKLDTTFGPRWLQIPVLNGGPICRGHCDLPFGQAFAGSGRAAETEEGCCRPRQEDALTVVMTDEAHNLALHRLPGRGDQDCFCVPCG